METLSETSISILTLADWTPTRSVEISKYQQGLLEEGYIVSKPVQTFLRSFGGIKVSYSPNDPALLQEELHFDPLIAAHNISSEWVFYYAGKLGTQLCVIGEAKRGYLTLVMGDTGQVYAFYDDFLYFVGKSGIEAINNLCEGKDLQHCNVG